MFQNFRIVLIVFFKREAKRSTQTLAEIDLNVIWKA